MRERELIESSATTMISAQQACGHQPVILRSLPQIRSNPDPTSSCGVLIPSKVSILPKTKKWRGWDCLEELALNGSTVECYINIIYSAFKPSPSARSSLKLKIVASNQSPMIKNRQARSLPIFHSERVGFEPTESVTLHRLSRSAP